MHAVMVCLRNDEHSGSSKPDGYDNITESSSDSRSEYNGSAVSLAVSTVSGAVFVWSVSVARVSGGAGVTPNPCCAGLCNIETKFF